ncbi:hypothetical protein J19TS2_30860 [Cohnella xylanilytica]|uniref:hypothetical protein n=1 Tax=Cohnella xylanilytica TaxID=557555 RepID=UPI001B152991|nr:hypothetical protein [Cohnella xylanilytica]GIO13531.1 hypothetical protein J19TS2_30860 [Cohnella xylanilytica]
MALSSQPSGQQWVRSYLKSLGYNDNQIGYNSGSKSVTLDGNDFFQPTYTKNGQAFGTTEQLDNAHNAYQYRQGQKNANDLLTRFRSALDKPVQQASFSYDANSDPQYQAALQQAQANAKRATGNAIASLNARGIDTSSVASDRAAQIEQQSLGQVTSEVLPQLVQQAYGRWANEQNMAYQREQDQLAGLMNLLGLTNQQNQQYLANQQQQVANRLNEKNANLNAALQYSNLTGQVLSPQSDWGGYARQISQGRTSNGDLLLPSLAGQQFQSGLQQQQFNQEQALREFNENARQFGMSYALDKLRTDASIMNQNEDNARQWAQLDWQMSQPSRVNDYNGISADKIYDAARARFQDDSGKIPNDPTTKEKIYLQVGQSGLPAGQDDQVMSMLGLTAADIEAFDRKYGVSGATAGK